METGILIRQFNNNIDNIVVVMTACVNPSPHRKLVRNDSVKRMDDYLYALKFWLTINNPRITGIVLLENSGCDGENFMHIVEKNNSYNRKFEYINIERCDIPDGVHYGWAEFKMLDEGIEKSLLCNKAKFLMKATGRYVFPNVSSYLNKLPTGTEISVHCRNYKLPWTKRILGVYAGIFLVTPQKYNEIIKGSWMELNENQIVIEVELWHRLVKLRGNSNILLRFPTLIIVEGQGGSGENLSSFNKKFKWFLRSLSAKIIPWWWI